MVSTLIGHLNLFKETYQEQQHKLKSAKSQLTNNLEVEQSLRSKMRINIESLLIDINEEIYAIREQVTSLLQVSQSPSPAQSQSHTQLYT